MPTYSTLRAQVLTQVNQDTDVTGSMKTRAENALTWTLNEVAVHVRPDELLANGTYTITSADSSLSISTDFSISDLDKPLVLTIDGDAWTHVEYTTWLRQQDAYLGDTRGERSWTYLGDTIHLIGYPADSATWDAILYYYKTPAAFADGGTPELPARHHDILVMGALRYFPDLFEDEGASIGTYNNLYQQGLKRIMKDRGAVQKTRQMLGRTSMAPGLVEFDTD